MPEAGAQPGTTDAILIARVRAGNQQAMAELYDRYSRLVYSVALRVAGDTAAAEDILQDVFLQLWRKPEAFDAARGSLAPWLAVIARNRAVDHQRKRRTEDIEECVAASAVDMESEADRSRMIEKIRGVMNAMSAEQRSAVEMAFFQGMTHAEIAEQSRQPLGTIKSAFVPRC